MIYYIPVEPVFIDQDDLLLNEISEYVRKKSKIVQLIFPVFWKGKKYRIRHHPGYRIRRISKSIEIKHTIPYAGIPHFPVSTVQGHKNLLIGKFGGKNVIAMQGRFHFYEGYPMQEVTFPIRVLHELGVKYLFVSNAAGGVNTQFLVGDLMIITDHINLFPEHPLRGKTSTSSGPASPA